MFLEIKSSGERICQTLRWKTSKSNSGKEREVMFASKEFNTHEGLVAYLNQMRRAWREESPDFQIHSIHTMVDRWVLIYFIYKD